MIDSPVLPALGGFAVLALLAFLQRKISKGGTPTAPVSPPPSPPEPGPSYSSPPDDPSDPEKYGGGPPPSDPPNSYHAKPPWPTRRALCWAIALFTLLLVVAITIAAVCGAGVCTAAPPSPPPPPPPTCPTDPTCSANTCNGKLFNEGLCCWDNTAMECTDDVCTTDGSSDEVLSLCLIGTPLATCFDGIANWVETDTDCGGGCTPCENHKRCAVNEDCDSAFCKIWVSPPSPPPPPRGRLLEYSQEWLNKWNGTNKYDSPPGICQNKDFLEPDKPDEDWDEDNKGLLVSSLPPTWSYSEHGFSCVSQRGEWLWWQGDEEIPDADWLGCQILGSASIFARPLANGVLPSDPSRLKVAPIDPIPVRLRRSLRSSLRPSTPPGLTRSSRLLPSSG